MRSIHTISAAVAFFTATALAITNSEFKPVSFAAMDQIPSLLTESFATFRWSGNSVMADESFDLITDDTTRIQVTDFKNRGDSFEVYDNGNLLGITSPVEVAADDLVFAATPEEALQDERFSKGEFTLEKGVHKITIKANGPYDAGTAAIRVLNHVNVAFHKKDDEEWHHDDDENDEEWHHDDSEHHEEWHHDDSEHNEEWHHDGDEHHEDDHDEHHEEHQKEENHEEPHVDDFDPHKDVHPPYYDLDISHTITVTKTEWVEPSFPTVAPHPVFQHPGSQHPDNNYDYNNGRDHNRNHDLPHVH